MNLLRNTSLKRLLAIVTAWLLLLSGIQLVPKLPTAEAKTAISVTATSEGTVAPGSSTTVQVTVNASETKSIMVDMEIFDASYARVAQVVKDNIQVNANVPTTVPIVWEVPASLQAGTYIVSLGVFGAGWNPEINEWFAGATRLQVSGGSTTPIPAPTGLNAVPAMRSVALTWNPVTNASGYEVEADGTVTAVTYASYEHTGLQPDTPHSYRVRAKQDAALGAWSPIVTTRTLPDPTLPASIVSLKVQTGSSSTTQMLGPNFMITNKSGQPLNLNKLKLRYYFTLDGEDVPLSVGFWSSAAETSVRFLKMPIPASTADYYAEFGFGDHSGTLAAGAFVQINTWMNKTDWSSFNQTNDYSYNGSTELAESQSITGYWADTLVWGIEPELLDQPAFPSNITAAPTDTAVALTWEPVNGATGYTVLADGKAYEVSSGTAFVHEWLKSGTRHTYKVKTKSGTQESVWSPPISVKTTGLQYIPAPTSIKSRKTDTSITLTWEAPDAVITGYDIEADGQLLDNGTSKSFVHNGLTPGSLHTYRVRAKEGTTLGEWSVLLTQNTTKTPNGPFDVQISVDPAAERAPISPYIYGTNDDLTGTEGWTARRMGGNRLTTYNWENNASNSGDDEGFHSDSYVAHYYGGVPWGEETSSKPGIGVTGFHQKSLAGDAYSLVTLQTAGYVAAKDTDEYVTKSETAPSAKWVQVNPEKRAPFETIPNVNDGAVYMDELVHAMVGKFGNASTSTGIRAYELDNEPEIWHKTHEYMHPQLTGAEEVLTKGIALAKAVKQVDPFAKIYGPVTFGFDGLYNMRGAPDWNALKGNYAWYLDYYLDGFRAEAAKNGGLRLLDTLDIHWYPETTAGGYRIQDYHSNDNLETNLARVQAPRQLWDPSYSEENNWLFDFYGEFFPLIPRLQQSIETYYPGTKLAITEYNFGGENNVYGGIAQADALGIFGKYGLNDAYFWRMTGGVTASTYISSAFKLYTNYDGAGSKYGDTKVKAETNDIENSSVYGSVYEADDGKLHLIVMNKNHQFDMNAVLNVAGPKAYKTARVWAFDANSDQITEREPVTGISGNSFTYTIPELTVCHIVLSAE